MSYFDYVGLVFKDIKKRKFSSFLTLIAISLGIMAIFVIVLVGNGFENSIQKQFDQLGGNKLYISSSVTGLASGSFTKGLTDKELNLVESRSFITKAYGYYMRNVQIKFGNEFKTNQVLGSEIDKEFFEEFNLDVAQGRFPKANEKYSLVLGPKAAEELFSKRVSVGSSLIINEVKYKVVGILESLGNPEDDSNIYVNGDTIRESFGAGDSLGIIYAIVDEGYDVNLAKDNLHSILENKLGKDTVEVQTSAQLLDSFGTILNIVKLTLGGIAFVSLVVGGVGIVNTMYVIVTEKTKEIGIMKAVGATNFDIFFIYVFQAGVFGFLGGLVGIGVGAVAAIGFEVWAKSFGYEFLEIAIDPVVAVSLLLFGFFVGAISGFLPARQASKLRIVDTLRK